MGGAGGMASEKDLSGIGSSRAGLETAAGSEPQKMLDQLPGWAAGDTMESWLTRLPGGDGGVSKPAEPAATAMAPEASTLGSLGAAPPVYAAGTGTRSEAGERAAVPMLGPGISGAAPAPAGPTTKPDDWVSVGTMPDSFHANQANLSAAQLAKPGEYNFNGVYAPKNLSQTNSLQYSSQGPQQPNPMAPGTTLTGADADNQPRMRRQLYDFNMNAYGNPFGPGGGAAGAARPWWEAQPSSFFTGGI